MLARGMGVGLLLGALVALVAVVGCDAQIVDLYTCAAPDKGHVAADGQPDPCHERDADAGADADAEADADADP